MTRTNYYYITGSGRFARLWYVDGNRNARVVAKGQAWDEDTAAWYGSDGTPALLPLTSD